LDWKKKKRERMKRKKREKENKKKKKKKNTRSSPRDANRKNTPQSQAPSCRHTGQKKKKKKKTLLGARGKSDWAVAPWEPPSILFYVPSGRCDRRGHGGFFLDARAGQGGDATNRGGGPGPKPLGALIGQRSDFRARAGPPPTRLVAACSAQGGGIEAKAFRGKFLSRFAGKKQVGGRQAGVKSGGPRNADFFAGKKRRRPMATTSGLGGPHPPLNVLAIFGQAFKLQARYYFENPGRWRGFHIPLRHCWQLPGKNIACS